MSSHTIETKRSLGIPFIQKIDPGDGGKLEFDESAYVEIISAGAETRKLMPPRFVGQFILLCLQTDGGDVVVQGRTLSDSGTQNIRTLGGGKTQITLDNANGVEIYYGIGVNINDVLQWRALAFTGGTLA